MNLFLNRLYIMGLKILIPCLIVNLIPLKAESGLKRFIPNPSDDEHKERCKEGVELSCRELRTIRLTRKKCLEGNMESCKDMGMIRKSQKEENEAERFFNLSCAGGHSDGCLRLGVIYERKKRKRKAREAYFRACRESIKEGNSSGCIDFGRLDADAGHFQGQCRIFQSQWDAQFGQRRAEKPSNSEPQSRSSQ